MAGNLTHAYFKQREKKTAEWRQKCIMQWMLGVNSSDNLSGSCTAKTYKIGQASKRPPGHMYSEPQGVIFKSQGVFN